MLQLFVPLAKVDVAQRLVYGLMTAERPDKSGEILDYMSAKPAIQKWSDSIKEASGGESLGNVRLMHTKEAVGLVKSIDFDDDAKAVNVCVYVEDEGAWQKVLRKVLTGFSIGGGYAKRWADPINKLLKRYTPIIAEVSLVDNPCLPGATFEMIKADGTSETISFYEPTNDEVKTLALDLAKAAGKPDRQNDFVTTAREDLY